MRGPRLVVQVSDMGVGPWVHEGFVPGVRPSHQEGWVAVPAAHVDYLALSDRLGDVSAVDDDLISDSCAHGATPHATPARR
jgi:hypothetical protein